MKVICLGNRFAYPDGAAMWFYEEMLNKNNLETIQWIEGGIGGLNLYPHLETDEPVLFLDYMPACKNGDIVSWEKLQQPGPVSYGHANALYYLLQNLPHLLDELPTISFMACNPEADSNEWIQTIYQNIEWLVEHA